MTSFDSVRPFLAEVAAPTPSVTGGGVSAVTVGAAAGLAAMTARLSTPSPGSTQRAEQAEHLQKQAMDLAASDAASYAAVLAAQRRSRDDPGRAAALREVLAAAAEPPGQIAALAAQVADLAAGLATDGKRALRGDAITAATLAAGAAHGSAALARINVTAAGFAAETAEAAERAATSAQHSADSALRTLDLSAQA